MPAIAQRTHKLAIERLKGIRDLTEISFEDKPLTGIFGPNCIGKSTILHALAAAYCAPADCSAAHYKQFFPPLIDDAWNGTLFAIEHSFITAAGNSVHGTVQYRKGMVTTRWTPTINRRPQRHVVFVGIKSCLPDLEVYPWHDLTGAVTTPCTENLDNRVREAAGSILNCNYTQLATVTLPHQPKRRYRALTRQDLGAEAYSSVTMGAGEQRLIRLLYAVEGARRHGLILVDELDLLLHGDALKKLVDYLACRCTERELQLVFTSHREELLSLKGQINIRHLHPQGGKHYCYADTDPDSMHRMTGNRVRPLAIFVEDDVAEAVASHVAAELGMSRHVHIIRFGAANNCFTVLAGLLLKGENCENTLFVLDGDVYRAPGEREVAINRACSGEDDHAVQLRATMGSRIRDFVLPAGVSNEPYLHHLICAQNASQMSAADGEIAFAATAIVHPPDRHGFIDYLVRTLGDNRQVQLTRIVPLAAKHPDWAGYAAPVRDWLTGKKVELNLQ
jgi:hypothetical protein